jgi:hypothetical protein
MARPRLAKLVVDQMENCMKCFFAALLGIPRIWGYNPDLEGSSSIAIDHIT